MARPPLGARLVQHKNGVYYARFVDQSGRSKCVSTRKRDPLQAQKVLSRILFAESADQPVPNRDLTIASVLSAYEKEYANKKYAGRKSKSEKELQEMSDITSVGIKHLIKFFGPDKDVRLITQTEIDDYVKHRILGKIGRQSTASSCRREIGGVLYPALTNAVRKKRLRETDRPCIDLPEKGEPKRRVLTESEIHRLFDIIPKTKRKRMSRIYRYLLILTYAPARMSAILELRWDQVNFETLSIDFNPVGRKQTSKRRPIIRISKELLPHLQRAYQEKKSDYVLDHTGAIQKTFARYAKKAGMGDVTSHTFRHTWATRAVMSGEVSFSQVALILGNTESVVRQTYAHLTTEHQSPIIDHSLVMSGL